MKAFLKSLDEKVWDSIETSWTKPITPIVEWIDAQKEVASHNNKAMNVIFNAVYLEEYKKISNVEVAPTV